MFDKLPDSLKAIAKMLEDLSGENNESDDKPKRIKELMDDKPSKKGDKEKEEARKKGLLMIIMGKKKQDSKKE